MKRTQLTAGRKWVMILIMAFFGRAIANVPYLREVYYDQIVDALHITNSQLGILASAVGIASLFGYFFGGFLADRFSARKIMIFSGVIGGIITLWYAAFPPFPVLIAIHALLALDGTLLFWSAYVRMIRLLGGKEGQGKYFGFSEGIRAAFGILLPLLCTWILSRAVSVISGLRNILLFYAVSYFVSALLCFFLIQDEDEEKSGRQKQKVRPVEYLRILKSPGLWLVSLLIFGTYTVFSLQSYTTPYLSSVCGVPTGTVTLIAAVRQYEIGIAAMPLFGILADNVMHSSARMCLMGAVMLIPCAIGLAAVPASSSGMIILLVLLTGFLAQGVRGIYYAAQDEAAIPASMAGAAAGIISTIGFSPDAFIFSLAGGWLDAYPPETAYRMIWITMMIGAGIAALSAFGILVIHHRNQRKNGE